MIKKLTYIFFACACMHTIHLQLVYGGDGCYPDQYPYYSNNSNEYIRIFTASVTTIFDINTGQTLDLSKFENRSGSPEKPITLPCLENLTFESWFAYNFQPSISDTSLLYSSWKNIGPCDIQAPTTYTGEAHKKSGEYDNPEFAEITERWTCNENPDSYREKWVSDVLYGKSALGESIVKERRIRKGANGYSIQDSLTGGKYEISIDSVYTSTSQLIMSTSFTGTLTATNALNLVVNGVEKKVIYSVDSLLEAKGKDHNAPFSGNYSRANDITWSDIWAFSSAVGAEYIFTLGGGVLEIGELVPSDPQVVQLFWYPMLYYDTVGMGNAVYASYGSGHGPIEVHDVPATNHEVWLIPTLTKVSTLSVNESNQYSIVETLHKSLPDKERGLQQTFEELYELVKSTYSFDDHLRYLRMQPSISLIKKTK